MTPTALKVDHGRVPGPDRLRCRPPLARTPLAATALNVDFPAHDFDGYWFFAGLRGDGPFQALMFGLSLGANDGYDWGFRHVTPDPDFGIVAMQAIGVDGAVGFAEQPVHRHRFRYARDRVRIHLEDVAHLEVDGDRLLVAMAAPDGSVSLELTGTLPAEAVWTPDLIFRGTAFVSVALTGVAFTGTLRVGDTEHAIDGVGTLDHPMGTVRRSTVSRGMGWWEYNAFHLEDGHTLFQWYAVDGDGDVLLAAVATDVPDGQLRLGTVEVAYTEWQDRGGIGIPTAWDVVATFDDGVARYSVTAVGPPWDGTAHQPGSPYPNFALRLEGELVPTTGPPTALRGWGTGETVVSERDPHRDAPQVPW